MVTAATRRNYIEALMRQQSSNPWPRLQMSPASLSSTRTQAAQTQQQQPAEAPRLNAADSAAQGFIKSLTSPTNPVGKIVGPALESNLSQFLLKAIGTTGAITAPITDTIAGAARNAAIDIDEANPALGKLARAGLSGVLTESSGLSKVSPARAGAKKAEDASLAQLPGKIGDNLYDLWNNDSDRQVQYGAQALDTLYGIEKPEELGSTASWIRAGLGLTSDIVTDPISYITGAAALKAGRVTKQTAKAARATNTPARDAFRLSDPDSLVRESIRNTESWRRGVNPTASRTAGNPLEATVKELPANPGLEAATGLNTAKPREGFGPVPNTTPATPAPAVNAVESALSVALRTGEGEIPKAWPFAPAGSPVRVGKNKGQTPLDIAVNGPAGAAWRPLDRAEWSAHRRWMDREVAAGRMTPEERQEIINLRNGEHPYEDFINLYDKVKVTPDESPAPAVAATAPLSDKAATKALESIETSSAARYSQIVAELDETLPLVHRGLIDKHLSEKISKKSADAVNPAKPDFTKSWNSVDGTTLFRQVRADMLNKGLMKTAGARNGVNSGMRSARVPATKELAEVMGSMDESLKAVGIQPTLGYKATGYPIGFGETLNILAKRDANTLSRMILDGVDGTNGTHYYNSIGVPHSNIADAVEKMLDAMQAGKTDQAALFPIVRHELFKAKRVTTARTTEFAENNPLRLYKDPKNRAGIERAIKGMPGMKGKTTEQAIQKLVNSYAALIFKSRHDLFKAMTDNAQAYGLGEVLKTQEISKATLRELGEVLNNGSVNDVLKAMDDPAALAKTVADDLAASPGARTAATEEIMEEIAKQVDPVTFEAIDMTTRLTRTYDSLDKAIAKGNLKEINHYRTVAAQQARLKHEKVADSVATLKGAKTIEDFEAAMDVAMDMGVLSRLWGGIDRFSKWFNRHLAFYNETGRMGNVYAMQNTVMDVLHRKSRADLNNLTKKYSEIFSEKTGSTVFDEAFLAYRAGTDVATLDPRIAAAMPEIREIIEFTTDLRGTIDPATGLRSLSVGALNAARNGSMALREAGWNIERLDYIFRVRYGLEDFFGPVKPKPGAKGKSVKPMSMGERALHWTTNEFDMDGALAAIRKKNPAGTGLGTADFLDMVTGAHIDVLKESTIAFEGVRVLKAMGAYVERPKAGFVKVGSVKDRGNFLAYLPDTAYIRAEEYQNILRLERHINSLATPNKSKIYGALRQHLFPYINMWKSWKTIKRPGHHVRNEIGDYSQAFMSGYMLTPGTMKEAARLLKHGGAWRMKESSQWTKADSLNSMAAARYGWTDVMDPTTAVGGDEIITTVKLKGGQELPLRARDLFADLQTEGALPSYTVREALADPAHGIGDLDPNRVDQLRRRFAAPGFKDKGGLAHPYAVAISEGRDHHMRTSLILQYMKKESKSFDNYADLFQAATRHTEKWLPSGKGMTASEGRYLNFGFAFYSWMRKAIPLTFESTFVRPGRFMAIPKASYAWAQANGIDPHSIADPFPEDQLFPSFLTDKVLGPQMGMAGDYLGVNPGVFNIDVLDTFSGSSIKHALEQDGVSLAALKQVGPLEGILGSLSPAIKAPIELGTGTNLATGANISDEHGYVDNLVPGADLLSSLFGKSASYTVSEPLRRAGSATTGQPYESDRNFSWGLADNRGQTRGTFRDANLRLLNFLLNSQAQNYSQPNYMTIGEIELRNQMGGFRD